MRKKDLIQAIGGKIQHYPKRDVASAVEAVFSAMKEALTEGQRIELRGFGVFSVVSRKARMGRNPKTGESVYVPSSRHLLFKTGKDLQTMIGGRDGSDEV
ncbi:MAG: integration host factor subunit beta [Deltaproteobacteria bacterium]|nr:integration host factor subunit beta [Deltaproteobacteria bacterium]